MERFGCGHGPGRFSGKVYSHRAFDTGLQVPHAVAISAQRSRDASVRDGGLPIKIVPDTELDGSNQHWIKGERSGERCRKL